VQEPTPSGNFLDVIARLERRIAALEGRTLRNVVIPDGGVTLRNGGRFSAETPDGVEMFYLGDLTVNGVWFRGIWMKREDGSFMMYTSIPGTDPDQVFFAWLDRNGTMLVSDDAVTGKGLARPWLAVPMTPLFSMSGIWSYQNIAATSIATETTLWSGRIPLVTHPRISIAGLWGQASGTNSATYKLVVGGTTIGTWSTGALENSTKGPFDITSKHEQVGLTAELRASASGTGQVAAHVSGCWLRQS
jgi:hypothetical protein